MNASTEPSSPTVALPTALWLSLGALAEAGYVAWALPSGAHLGFGSRLALYLFLFATALAAAAVCRRRQGGGRDLRWALALALLFRLTALCSAPILSDDVYRYIWEGSLQARGVNPYLHAPSDPALATLRDPLYERINHPEVHTLYPPLSQLFFAAVVSISKSVTAMKLLMLVAEVGTSLLLVQIGRLRGMSLAGLLLYLWNPLVILESSGSGHNDALGIALLVSSSLCIILRRPAVSIAALSGAIAAKYFPLIVLPLWLRAVPRRWWALPPLLWLLLWAPYLGAGPRLWSGIQQYALHWEGNAFLFRFLTTGVARMDPKPFIDRQWGRLCETLGRPDWAALVWPYTEPRQLAKALVAIGLLLVLARWLRSRAEPPCAAFRILGLALLWAPTLHPWYVQWVLPFAALFASASWFVLSATVFLAYAPRDWAGLSPDALLWVEYAPFLAVWLWEELRRREKPGSGGDVGAQGRGPAASGSAETA